MSTRDEQWGKLIERLRSKHAPHYPLMDEAADAITEAREMLRRVEARVAKWECEGGHGLHVYDIRADLTPPVASEPASVCGGLIGSRMCSRCGRAYFDKYGERCTAPAQPQAEAREQNVLDNTAIDALADELQLSGAQAARIYIQLRNAILTPPVASEPAAERGRCTFQYENGRICGRAQDWHLPQMTHVFTRGLSESRQYAKSSLPCGVHDRPDSDGEDPPLRRPSQAGFIAWLLFVALLLCWGSWSQWSPKWLGSNIVEFGNYFSSLTGGPSEAVTLLGRDGMYAPRIFGIEEPTDTIPIGDIARDDPFRNRLWRFWHFESVKYFRAIFIGLFCVCWLIGWRLMQLGSYKALWVLALAGFFFLCAL